MPGGADHIPSRAPVRRDIALSLRELVPGAHVPPGSRYRRRPSPSPLAASSRCTARRAPLGTGSSPRTAPPPSSGTTSPGVPPPGRPVRTPRALPVRRPVPPSQVPTGGPPRLGPRSRLRCSPLHGASPGKRRQHVRFHRVSPGLPASPFAMLAEYSAGFPDRYPSPYAVHRYTGSVPVVPFDVPGERSREYRALLAQELPAPLCGTLRDPRYTDPDPHPRSLLLPSRVAGVDLHCP